jgi:hypothetical protein
MAMLINSICNMEELPNQRKQSINVSIYKKGYKTECSDYCGISILSGKKGKKGKDIPVTGRGGP